MNSSEAASQRRKGMPSDDITRIRTAMEHGLKVFINAVKNRSTDVIRDYEGNEMTMLHIAVGLDDDYKRLAIVKYLLTGSSNVNALATFKDDDSDLYICGRTPLHIAALCGYADVIRPLLDRGADHLAKDSTGLTPIDLADQYDNYGCIIALLHHHVTKRKHKNQVPSTSDVSDDDDLLSIILKRNTSSTDIPPAPAPVSINDSILDRSVSEWLNTSKIFTRKLADNEKCKVFEIHDDMADVTLIEEQHLGLDDSTIIDELESSLCNRTIRPGSNISFNTTRDSIIATDSSMASSSDVSHVLNQQPAFMPPDTNRRVQFGYEMWLHCPKSVSKSDKVFYSDYLKHQEGLGIDEMPQRSLQDDGLLSGYPTEINDFVTKENFCFIMGKDLEEKLSASCVNLQGEKNNFVYLLLDPNVCGDLPTLVAANPNLYAQHFAQFIRSIFYVGKSQVERQYAHLYEAAALEANFAKVSPTSSKLANKLNAGKKIEKILSLWSDGGGVLSLHCFRGVSSLEAVTREALIIEALGGRENLTNAHRTKVKMSQLQSMSQSDHRLLGSYLLWIAYRTLLIEGIKLVKKCHV